MKTSTYGTINSEALLQPLAVALLIGLLLAFLYQRKYVTFRSVLFSRFIEPLLLLGAACLSVGFPFAGMVWEYTFLQPGAYLLVAALFGVVLAMRWIQVRTTYLLFCLLWCLSCFAGAYCFSVLPTLRDIRDSIVPGTWSPDLLISAQFSFVRHFTWCILTTLSGLYFVRYHYTIWNYLGGCAAGGYLAYWLLSPFYATQHPLTALWYILPVSAALVLLPYQRTCLERLVGFSLSRDQSAPDAQRKRLWNAFPFHAALLILVALLQVSAFVDYFESRQLIRLNSAPLPKYRSPALTNAYTDLKRLYLKPPASPRIPLLENDQNLTSLTKLLDIYTSQSVQNVWSEVNSRLFREHLLQVSEHLTAYDSAARSDYLQPAGRTILYYLHLKEVTRLIVYRSSLALYEGRDLDAGYDVRTILNFASLFNDAPTLLEQMIGTALRELGIRAVYGLLESRRNNEQAVMFLADTLKDIGPRARVGLNFQELARGQDGTGQTVVPNADLILPAFGRAFNNSMMAWLNFDLVQIATALELYRIQNAVYPARLQNLQPAYLRRIPRNPFDGMYYRYKPTFDGEYELSAGFTPGKDFTMPLVFPLSRANEPSVPQN